MGEDSGMWKSQRRALDLCAWRLEWKDKLFTREMRAQHQRLMILKGFRVQQGGMSTCGKPNTGKILDLELQSSSQAFWAGYSVDSAGGEGDFVLRKLHVLGWCVCCVQWWHLTSLVGLECFACG